MYKRVRKFNYVYFLKIIQCQKNNETRTNNNWYLLPPDEKMTCNFSSVNI